MEQFLNTLYNNEYFGFYLIIAIIVLVILFLIILFFGKKDQKVREIEATKKLQQINTDAFKEESNEEKLEIDNLEQKDNVVLMPSISDNEVVSTFDEIPDAVIPVVNEEVPSVVANNNESIEVKSEPLKELEEDFVILEKQEEKPLMFETNVDLFKDEEIKFEEPVVQDEKIDLPKEIEVPEFNFDEVVKEVEEAKQNETYKKGPQIFSSVYVPENKVEKEVEIAIPVSKVEEPEFELPVLKKEPKVEVEVPAFNDFNLDDITGESYTINK